MTVLKICDNLPDATRARYHAIWNQTPDGLLHKNESFGCLTVEICHHSSFHIEYEGCAIDLDLPNNQVTLHQLEAHSQTLPEFYLLERIGYPFLRVLSGYVLLHCGAVATSDGCIGLLALPGVGKSTLTAALLDRISSARLVADDILAVCGCGDLVYAVPSSSHIAMRHGMFDNAEFVELSVDMGFKKALCVCSSRCQGSPVPLKTLIVLRAADSNGSIRDIDKTEILPDILRQQMTISNPPQPFVRAQFAEIIRVVNHVQLLELPVSIHCRQDIDATVAQILQCI